MGQEIKEKKSAQTSLISVVHASCCLERIVESSDTVIYDHLMFTTSKRNFIISVIFEAFYGESICRKKIVFGSNKQLPRAKNNKHHRSVIRYYFSKQPHTWTWISIKLVCAEIFSLITYKLF